MNKNLVSRRTFIEATVGAAGASLLPASKFLDAEPIPPAAQDAPASDRVRFGIVGVGMEGSGLLSTAIQLRGVECVAAADLYDGRHELAKEIVGKPIRTTRRYKELLDAKDIDAIMKGYVPDESLLVFDLVPPRQYAGAAAYRKDWQDLLALFPGPLKFGVSDLHVFAAGRLGYGYSIQHLSGADAKGQTIDLTVRVTDVYRKIKGHWLIVHEHVSVPVDLATGKPDLASKP